MRLFARKKTAAPTANPNANGATTDEITSVWSCIQRDEQKQQAREEKDRRRRVKRMLKQMQGAAKHVHKLRFEQERRARHQLRKTQRLKRRREREERRRRRQRQRQRQRQQQQLQRSALDTVDVLRPPPLMKQSRCAACSTRFQLTAWRHHCRNCGRSFCTKCLSTKKRAIPWFQMTKPQKVCVACDLTVFSTAAMASRPAVDAASRPMNPGTRLRPVNSTVPPRQVNDVEPASTFTQRQAQAQAQASASNPASDSERSSSGPPSRSAPVSSEASSAPASPAAPASVPVPLARRLQHAHSSRPHRRSRWLLPFRPFLKRKASVERLRNQTLGDPQLMLEKRRQYQSSTNEHVVDMASCGGRP